MIANDEILQRCNDLGIPSGMVRILLLHRKELERVAVENGSLDNAIGFVLSSYIDYKDDCVDVGARSSRQIKKVHVG